MCDMYSTQGRMRRSVWLVSSSTSPFFVLFHLPLVPLTSAAYLNLHCQTQCQAGDQGVQKPILHLISWAVFFYPQLNPTYVGLHR